MAAESSPSAAPGFSLTSRTTLFSAAFVLAATPAVYIGLLILRFGVDVPLWDDWDMVPMIIHAHSGTLSFSELFAQQLEARTFLPKLLFILMTLSGRYDARDAMLLSLVICCLTAIGIFLLLRKSKLPAVVTVVCFLLIVLSLFSPAQEELWLLASGFPSFMPPFFILAALLVLRSRISLPVKFGTSAALAVASTFTLAHGLLAFALTFPVYLLWEKTPRWQAWLGAWCALGGACAVAYFWDYQKPAQVPAFAPPVPLLAYVHYFTAFLGGNIAYGFRPFSRGVPLLAGTIAGATLLLLFAGALAYVVHRRSDREFLRQTLPWLALGGYSIGCAIPASLGRIGLGVAQALDSRYVTFSLYLTASLIALGAIVMRDLRERNTGMALRRIAPALCALLALGYVGFYIAGFGTSVALLEERAARYRLGRAAIVLSHALNTSEIMRRNNTTIPATARDLAFQLDRLSLLEPPLVRTPRLNTLSLANADGDDVDGKFDRAFPIGGGLYGAAGWAALEDKSRPADCVVLAYQTPAHEWIAFAMSDKAERRPDIAAALRDEDQLWSGWTAKFPVAAVPPGATVAAWALDADELKFYRLPGEIVLARQ